MRKPRTYLFSGRHITTGSLISAAMGIISFAACFAVQMTVILNGGTARLRDGAVVFVCIIFSLIGLITAILSVRDPDARGALTAVAAVLNAAVLIYGFVIVYYGVV